MESDHTEESDNSNIPYLLVQTKFRNIYKQLEDVVDNLPDKPETDPLPHSKRLLWTAKKPNATSTTPPNNTLDDGRVKRNVRPFEGNVRRSPLRSAL